MAQLHRITELPRAIVPAGTGTRRTRVVVGLLLMAALMGPCSCVVAATNKPSRTPPLRFEAEAEAVATAWLRGDPLPVAAPTDTLAGAGEPNTSDSTSAADSAGEDSVDEPVAPTQLRSLSWISGQRESVRDQQWEVHRLLAVTDLGVFEVGVTLLVVAVDDGDAATRAVLAAEPTLTPVTALDDNSAQLSFNGRLTETSLTAGGRNQIEDWAEAFVTDDREALYGLTGDTTARVYAGLSGGWQQAEGPTVTAVWTADEDAQVATVRLQLQSANGGSLVASYDILLGGTDSRELPTVQAWGPAGSALELVPFQNGIPAQDAAEPTTTSTTVADSEGN